MENRQIHLVDTYKKYQIPIWSICIATIMFFIYLYKSTVNVPVMDYWTYICDMTERVYNGTFSFEDIWTSMGGHRGGLSYLFIAINIGIFKMNTLVGIYGGLVILFVITIMIGVYYQKHIECNEQSFRLKQILFILIPVVIYNLNQWEILTLDFSFNSALRRLSFIVVFIWVEKIILGDKRNNKNLIAMLIYILFVICFISTGFLPGLIGAVFFALIVDYIVNLDKYNKRFPSYYVTIILVCIGGLIVYTYGLVGLDGEGRSLSTFINDCFNGNLFKGIFIMLGSSIIHISVLENIGVSWVITFGFILFMIYITAIILYFKNQMWKKFYLPLILMAYTAINILIIYYARGNAFNLNYLGSSRYTCETTLGLIGLLMIFIQTICAQRDKYSIKNVMYMLPWLLICISLLYSFKTEFQMGPYRKAYQSNLIEKMKNIDSYTDDELAVFQANDPEQVRQGVQLMKQYKLGIFKDLKDDEMSQDTMRIIKRGFYEDGWIEGIATIEFTTSSEQNLNIKGYYPYEINTPLEVKITVNDNEQYFTIQESSFSIDVSLPQNTKVVIKIQSDFEREASDIDKRKVAFLIDSLTIQ